MDTLNLEPIRDFIKKGMSQGEIAIKMKTQKHTIAYFLKKHGLKTERKSGGSIGKNLSGKKIGHLKIISIESCDKYGKRYLCKCDCGKEKVIRGATLTSEKILGCGCSIGKSNLGNRYDRVAKNTIGKKFNFLTIVSIEHQTKNGKANGYSCNCLCDCGNHTRQIYADLVKSKVKSCGCYQKEMASIIGSKIGLNNGKNLNKWYFILDGKKRFCRSGFEVFYANYLMDNNIEFVFEIKSFKLLNGKRYLPDFYLKKENKYIEIKGYFSEISKEKINLFSFNNKIEVLLWNKLVEVCKLPFKSYSNYKKRAEKLNMSVCDYLAQKRYVKKSLSCSSN